MLLFVVKRSLAALAVLWMLTLVIFVACEILPGDVAEIQFGQYGTPETVAALREELGLDRPAPERYITWLGGIIQGDWGTSITTRGPVSALLSERLVNTARLSATAAAIAVPLAVVLGILMAIWRGRPFDKITSILLLLFSATPEFLLATIGVLVISVHLGWLPAISYVDPGYSGPQLARALALPVAILVLHIAAQIARMTRATLVNIMTQPYMEMATLKGLSPLRSMLTHALPNVVGPVANVVALNVAYLVGGVVIVETVFAYPGMARLMIDAVTARDMPVIQACAMIFSLVYVVLLFVADVIAVASNPKARHQAEAGRS